MNGTRHTGPPALCDCPPFDTPSFSVHTSCTSTIAQHREICTQTSPGLLMPDQQSGARLSGTIAIESSICL